ncbi:hypothetical protein OC846_002392 [Tilletia horrida]|uniref:Uncharacterized protein n=1 Tax=Tilletia horrida TaxID=155126 RepID=A0AAN6GTR9_9BASI|nr:hypothetical protein OC846_002392 [Tilletia horrida]KAK0567640.1 hypothetical protein OC861_002595 [Tilletia horrida]
MSGVASETSGPQERLTSSADRSPDSIVGVQAPADSTCRRASLALLAADPAHDRPAVLTQDPCLLKPAMQSCLKNSFRLSLPFNPVAGASTVQATNVTAAAALPYPATSIIFPSEADIRARAYTLSQDQAESSDHPVLDSKEERAAMLQSEDARRASDPDVSTDFESELFRWAEQESLIVTRDRRRGDPYLMDSLTEESASCDVSMLNSPNAFDEGYRADLDSPFIDRDQHRVGTRIHTQAGTRNRIRVRAQSNGVHFTHPFGGANQGSDDESTQVDHTALKKTMFEDVDTVTIGSPPADDEPLTKTPRFSLHTELVPRVGSPTHDRQVSISQMSVQANPNTPAIVLPTQSPEEEDFGTQAEGNGSIHAWERLRSHVRTSTLNAPKTPYSWVKEVKMPTSPGSLVPPDEDKQAKASLPPVQPDPTSKRPHSMPPPGLVQQPASAFPPSQPIPIPGPTRLQSRRPQSMRLRNLPDASIWAPVEIEVNGKSLAGRDMDAAAVYDPRNDLANVAPCEEAPPVEAAKENAGLGASPEIDQALLQEAVVNPPPPTPPRGTQLRMASKVRRATLNAIALKANIVPDGNTQEGIMKQAEEPSSSAYQVLGAGIGLGLSAGSQNEGKSEEVQSAERTEPKHRSLATKLPEQVVPRPEVENWLKDSSKPQPKSEEVAQPDNMKAWARKTFEATGRGTEPGVINAPPSAYVGVAPSPCPMSAAVMNHHARSSSDDEQSESERLKHRLAAEAKLNGTPLLESAEAELIITAKKDDAVPSDRNGPILRKGLISIALPSNAVSLNSASTTASGVPFFAGLSSAAQATGTPIKAPRDAVLVKDRARRPADASAAGQSVQVDSVLSAFSTEQLLAHLAARETTPPAKATRKASTVSVASSVADESSRTRSPLIPQGAATSPALSSRGPIRAQKRNSAQRALARNRQRLANESLAGASLMARMDSISSVGSADMVREGSVSSFGDFVSQSPLLVFSARATPLAGPGGQDTQTQNAPLIDLTSPGERRQVEALSPVIPTGLDGAGQDTSEQALINPGQTLIKSFSQSSSNFDDELSLLTSRSSNHLTISDVPTPATEVNPVSPIGSMLISALARARLHARASTPLDPMLGLAHDRDGARQRLLGQDGARGDQYSSFMERADSTSSSPLLAAS